jgi:hypothetical protein
MEAKSPENAMPIDITQLSPSSRRIIAEERARRDLIDRHTTAAILGVTIRTLQRWHDTGFGPPRRNDPRKRVRYSRPEVEQWAASNGYPK